MNNGKNSDAVVLGWQGHLGVHCMPQFGLSVHLWALFSCPLFLEKIIFCTVCIIHHSSKYNRQIGIVIEFRKAIFPVTSLNHIDYMTETM